MFSKYSVKDFMGKPAPPGYVAGLGRGATGFTTRPDLGPARDDPVLYEKDDKDDDDEHLFDENEAGLLSTRRTATAAGLIDPEDEEADRIYASIDAHLSERRKTRRERTEAQEQERLKALEPKTGQLFADLKRELGRVTMAEWEALPEVGDFRAKRLKKTAVTDSAKERYLPLPDSTINAPRGINAIISDEADAVADVLKIGEAKGRLLGQALDSSGSRAGVGNGSSSAQLDLPATSAATPSMDVGDVKRARLLFASILKTDRKNVSAWQSAVRLEVSAGNVKQARQLLTRACDECPGDEDLWMEAVQLAPADEAGKLLARALKACPHGIKLWLMAANRDPANRKKILRAALESNPASAELWMQLVEAEEEAEDARLLLSRAVECVTEGSVQLWLALARLQARREDAQGVLNRAMQACPDSLAIWVHAARLEEAASVSGSDGVVSGSGSGSASAPASTTTSTAVSTTASAIASIIKRAIDRLAPSDAELLAEAQSCELGDDWATMRELCKHVSWPSASKFIYGDGDGDAEGGEVAHRRSWDDFPQTVKALLAARLSTHGLDEQDWQLTRSLAEASELPALYRAQLSWCPSVRLWIELAGLQIGPVERGAIFEEAMAAASVDAEREALCAARVRMDFAAALKAASAASATDASAVAADCQSTAATAFLQRAQSLFPASAAVQLEAVRIARLRPATEAAAVDALVADEQVLLTAAYSVPPGPKRASFLHAALLKCPTAVSLACLLASMQPSPASARAVLERCRLQCAKAGVKRGVDQLWAGLCLVEGAQFRLLVLPAQAADCTPSVFYPFIFPLMPTLSQTQTQTQTLSQMEPQSQSQPQPQPQSAAVKVLLSQGLKECPQSGALWFLAVCLEPRQLRRSKCLEALRRLERADPRDRALLHLALGAVLEETGGLAGPAAKEYSLSLSLDPSNADIRKVLLRKGLVSAAVDCAADELHGAAFERFVHEGAWYYALEDAFEQFCNK